MDNKNLNMGHYLDLIKLSNKTFKSLGYLDMIEQIYRSLKIFEHEFNWNDFNNKISN